MYIATHACACFRTYWSDNSQSNSAPLLSLSLILSSVLAPSSNPSYCPCACCSSMCDWWRGASVPSSATQHSSVPEAPPSFSLTCRHQMAHHLPPTVNKSCNYPSCPTKGNSHFNKCTVQTRTHTCKEEIYTQKAVTMHAVRTYVHAFIFLRIIALSDQIGLTL